MKTTSHAPLDGDRLMCVVSITRDHYTGRFHLETAFREGYGALEPWLRRDGSPLLFGSSIVTMVKMSDTELLSRIRQRWGAALWRDDGAPFELPEWPAPATE